MDTLIIGKISTKDLASWFGISYSTFRKKSTKLLEELEIFCDYEKYYGGVSVTHIYIPKYYKDMTAQVSKVYLEEVKETKNYLSTVAGMARKLIKYYPDTWGQYSQSGLEKKLRKAGNSLFGKTNLPLYRHDQQERYSGPYGYREYRWAIKVSDFNQYRFLTEDEQKAFGILLDSYHVTKEDIALKEQYDKQKLKELEEDKITKEEYILAMSHSELFPDLLDKFRDATGLSLAKATYHDIQESVF